MQKYFVYLSIFFILQLNLVIAQTSAEFLPDKTGNWSYHNNITSKEAEFLDFRKNIAALAEWFHQNVIMLSKPKGFELLATTYGQFDKYYRMSKSNYSLRTQMRFSFQLFLSKGGKWTVEPPSYSFFINDTESGHHSHGNHPYFDELKDEPSLEKAINIAAIKMNGIIASFEFQKQLAPGVDLYREAAEAYPYHIVVYNPERPPYWLPVTVKELAAIYVEYYSLYQKREIDQLLLKELKNEIANIPPGELNSQAYLGHESNIVFRINGKDQGQFGSEKGIPLMRFNPDYWDRTRPTSDIQFMTFFYPQMNEAQLDEYYKNNGHPYYGQIFVNQVNWNEVVKLVKKVR